MVEVGPSETSSSERKTTFSFDSSGWLYVYHLGAARYLQQHILPHLPPESVAFSGSSGGALVAASLCTGLDVEALTQFVIDCQPECEFNPWRMLPCAEEALRLYLPDRAHERAQNRLRVLVTRIELRWRRWFVRPEALCTFHDHAELSQALRASCHIPVLGGLRPYSVQRADGTSRGAFYDGLFWPSMMYMWRAFDASDAVLKVSGLGWPTAHIRLPLPVPPHWIVLPPSQRTLWRLYAAGYDDTAQFFAREDAQRWLSTASGRHSPSPDGPTTAKLPPPSALPAPPQQRDRTLLHLMVRGWLHEPNQTQPNPTQPNPAKPTHTQTRTKSNRTKPNRTKPLPQVLGWLHLLALTLFLPLVPPYLAVRALLRKPSPLEVTRVQGEMQGQSQRGGGMGGTSPLPSTREAEPSSESVGWGERPTRTGAPVHPMRLPAAPTRVPPSATSCACARALPPRDLDSGLVV